MFRFAALSNFFLGNKILLSGNSLFKSNLLGNVSGEPTSKKLILDTGHQWAVSFRIILHDRISDPFLLLMSTILLTLVGLDLSSNKSTTSPMLGVLKARFLFLVFLDSYCLASRSFSKSKYNELKSFSMSAIEALNFLNASPKSF